MLISLLKPQTTKIIFINKKISLTHQNHNISLSYKLSTNNQNLINNKESIHNANISIKATNNQNNLHKQENKPNTPKSQHIFVEVIP
jgi:iron only hydrogenase large subunit-like protein